MLPSLPRLLLSSAAGWADVALAVGPPCDCYCARSTSCSHGHRILGSEAQTVATAPSEQLVRQCVGGAPRRRLAELARYCEHRGRCWEEQREDLAIIEIATAAKRKTDETFLSLHPKFPFLADNGQRLTFLNRARLRWQRRCFGTCVIADSTQALRTGVFIPPAPRDHLLMTPRLR